MVFLLFFSFLRRHALDLVLENYINALGPSSQNRVATVTYESVPVTPLYISWQLNSLTFGAAKADFETILGLIESSNPSVAAIGVQMDVTPSNDFKAAAILEQVAELATSRAFFSKFERSMVASNRYLATLVFAEKSRAPEFSYKSLASCNHSHLVGVTLDGSDRKLGFVNSNFDGVANTQAEITRVVEGFGLSKGANRTENTPSNVSEYAVVLWGGDFKVGTDSQRAKDFGTQNLYDVEWMAQNRGEMDPMTVSFGKFWPTNCFEDESVRAPTYGYKGGSLAVSYIPGWHTRIVVYENVLDQPRKTVEYSVVAESSAGVNKPVLGVYEFQI